MLFLLHIRSQGHTFIHISSIILVLFFIQYFSLFEIAPLCHYFYLLYFLICSQNKLDGKVSTISDIFFHVLLTIIRPFKGKIAPGYFNRIKCIDFIKVYFRNIFNSLVCICVLDSLGVRKKKFYYSLTILHN